MDGSHQHTTAINENSYNSMIHLCFVSRLAILTRVINFSRLNSQDSFILLLSGVTNSSYGGP